MDKRTEAVPPSKRPVTEKDILTYYLVKAEYELLERARKEGVDMALGDFRNQELEVDSQYRPNFPTRTFTFNIEIKHPTHIPILKRFEAAAKHKFTRSNLPDIDEAEMERLNSPEHTGLQLRSSLIKEDERRLKLNIKKDGRTLRVSIRIPSGLSLLNNLKEYVDNYLEEREFAGIREAKASRFRKAVGPFSERVIQGKKPPESSHELPKALCELMDAITAKIELRIAPELEKKQGMLERGKRLAPFKFSAVVPLNITDWRDQSLFVKNLHDLLDNKMHVTNRKLLHFQVVYPDKGINLCFVGPQLETVIEYPAGLKTLKELRKRIERYPKEITYQTFPLLHEPVRPPHNERELMVDLLDSTQTSLRDLYTKLKVMDANVIAAYVGEERNYLFRRKNRNKELEYAQAVLKFESPVTASIFTDILQSLACPKSPEMRKRVYGILFDFFHPHSLELYDQSTAEKATHDLCVSAMLRLSQMGIDNEQTTTRNTREITLKHVKNGSLQSLAQLLSIMFGDETLREYWITRYAQRIYKADHMRESVGFAADIASEAAHGAAVTR